MSPDARDDLLLRLFQRQRAAGLALGIAELMAARAALQAGFGTGEAARLKCTLRLLWCKSAAQNADLDAQVDTLLAEQRSSMPRQPEPEPGPAAPPLEPPPEMPEPEPSRASPPAPSAPAVKPLPVRAPEQPVPSRRERDLVTHDPVSRRTMAYAWRYLRRPVKDGPCDRVDLSATLERAARQGFFDRPVLERRTTDHGHLILLVDQGGSMVPFHRLTRDLVQTAVESGLRVDVGYFQNVPPGQVYQDPHRTRPLALKRLLAECTPESSVLVVSDAGAARGGREQSRFQASARVLVQIKCLTASLAWLNPVPTTRWPGTTAQLIALLVPMFPMDEDGFGNAVDILRGQAAGGSA